MKWGWWTEIFHKEQYNFKPEDVVILTDDAEDPRLQPTRENMLNAMRWLVYEAQPHDSLFFHCTFCEALSCDALCV